MLNIDKIILGVCSTNCYYMYRENSSEVILVDPAEKGDFILSRLKQKGLSVKNIIITHGHFDHIMGAEAIRKATGAVIYAPEADRVLLSNAEMNLSVEVDFPYTLEADKYVKEGDVLEFGDMKCRVISTPGHTVGSVCYYFEEDKVLLSGDTMFYDSVGRTDFPTGSMASLISSVREKLYVLPEDTKVYPGHGPATDIGTEIRNGIC